MHDYNIIERGMDRQHATNALILLHGRGAMAEDILGLASYFTDETWYVAAPQATNNTWYPYSFMAPIQENEPWLSSAITVLHRLIKDVTKVLPAKHVYIMGFSQGACLATEVTARFATHYGGIVGFTGGLIGRDPDYASYKGSFDATPVYLSNGDTDPHVPRSRSEETKRQFERMGAVVSLDIFPNRMHMISEVEMKAARDLLFQVN